MGTDVSTTPTIQDSLALIDSLDTVAWFCPICGTACQLSGLKLQGPPYSYEYDEPHYPVPLWMGYCSWCGCQLRVIGKHFNLVADQGELRVECRARQEPPLTRRKADA